MTPPSVKWADPSTAWNFTLATPSPLFPRSGLALLEDPSFIDGISPSPIFAGQRSLWRLNPLWNGNLAGPVILAQNGGAPKTPAAASAAPAVTPAAAPMTPDRIWKLVMDSVALVESMDVTGKNMTINGGIAGCRFPEFSLRNNSKDDQKNCKVMFEANTHGLVKLQVRKIRGANESRITGFLLGYDKEVVRDTWPDSQVPVTGFHFIPAPEKNIPFYEEADPPSFNGFGLKYMPTRAGILNVPLIGFPLYKIFAEDSKKLEFTADYLSSWGLDDAGFYKEAHTQRYRIPQSTMDFFRLIRHADIDPPAWINLNKTNKKPDLLDWLSFQEINITAHLREGILDIPNVGAFQLSRNKARQKLKPLHDKLQELKSGCEYDRLFKEYTQLLDQTARLEIHGNSAKIDATLFNPELPSLNFSNDRFDLQIKGLTAQSAGVELPPLRKLIDEIKKGTLNPSVHFKGAHADRVVMNDKASGATTTIESANIDSLDLQWPSSVKMTGISASKLDVEQASSELKFSVVDPKITSASVQRQKDQIELILGQVSGSKMHLGYSSASLDANQSTLTNLRLKDGSGITSVTLDAVESSGAIEYSIPSADMSLKTSGKSKLTNLKMSRQINAAGETEIGVEIGLAGTISKLSLKRGEKLSADFSDSAFSEGKLRATVRLSNDPDSSPPGLKYFLDAKINKITVDGAQFGPLAISPSKVTNGEIHLSHDTWDLSTLPQMDVSGTLDFHVDKFSGSGESFNLPGFSVSGTVKNIALQGDARVRWNQGDWSLEKPSSDQPKPLKFSAVLENATLSQDPHQLKGSDLTKWAGNQVVKSEMKVNSAKFFIDDVEQVDFAPSDKTAQATSGLRKVSVKGLRFEEIDAGGVVWAKFPVFYYLRGLFPKIGTIGQGPDMKTSFLRLGAFEMKVEDNKPVTTFRDFNTELYEVGGRDQFAKVSIPLLIVSPFGNPLIDTGGTLTKVDINLKDKLRGGSFHFESVPRPLEERRSRVVPVAK